MFSQMIASLYTILALIGTLRDKISAGEFMIIAILSLVWNEIYRIRKEK